jgi:hypothetical protein
MEENKSVYNKLHSKKYTGNAWLCGSTISLIVIGAGLPLLFWPRFLNNPVPAIVCVIFFVVLQYMNTHIQMNYFVIDKEMFIVKNHYSFRERTIIPLHEISSFEIIKPSRLPNALKICKADGNTEQFIAASLNKKDWKMFKRDMTDAGFSVKDDGNIFF